YHASLFAIGAALFFGLSPRLRFWLARPQPYAAALLAFVFFLPVIVWNARNDWVSFAFQLGRGADTTVMGTARILTVFALEALYLLPTTMFLLIAAVIWVFRAKDVC